MVRAGELTIVDRHLVGRVLGVSEHSRAEPYQKRLISDLAHELRRGLAVLPAKQTTPSISPQYPLLHTNAPAV